MTEQALPKWLNIEAVLKFLIIAAAMISGYVHLTSRLAVLETRAENLQYELRELKGDVKILLWRRGGALEPLPDPSPGSD